MRRILIFGNSSSGKSTLTKKISQNENIPYLDLDTVAWSVAENPIRKPIVDSVECINAFIKNSQSWILEGCYVDLLERFSDVATEIIFLDISPEECVKHAKSRPWEPHKYKTKEEQDANLEMLITWIRGYNNRSDGISYTDHQTFFESFLKKKIKITHSETSY